jgi:hypothetical protein
MDTRLYRIVLDLELDSTGTPDTVVSIDGVEIYCGTVDNTTHIHHDQELAPGKHTLTIDHCNKLSSDPSTELIIQSIRFNGIASPQFVWQGIYTPDYPEPWATEQIELNRTLALDLPFTNHMGWNGRWTLTFTAPIFTWIHQVEDLGWIHQ